MRNPRKRTIVQKVPSPSFTDALTPFAELAPKKFNNNPSTSALARLCTSCLYANGKWKSNMELMGQQKVLIGYNVARTTKKDVAFGSTAGFYFMCALVVHCSLGIHFDT